MGARIPKVPEVYDKNQFIRMMATIENRFAALEAVSTPTVFTIQNGATRTTLDVSTATLAQLREFVGTLVTEMQKAGKLGKP